MTQADSHFAAEAGAEEAGLRLDVFLAGIVEDASRSYLQKLIKGGSVSVDGKRVQRPAKPIVAGEFVEVVLPPPPPTHLEPEEIPLDIIYEDADVVVVNKQAGLVVHPAPGHAHGTLVHALLHHCPDFQRAGGEADRPGIVHRLDRDTSGLLVVAKSPRAFQHLGQQVRGHAFDRRYIALVRGEFEEESGRIIAAVGRSLADRKRMTVTGVRGRPAATRFEVIERFGKACLVGLRLETGRTHQIRVHLRFAGRPVLGDPLYGETGYAALGLPEETAAALEGLRGQALHAERLGFVHPTTGADLCFTAPPPPDFAAAIEALRALSAPSAGAPSQSNPAAD